MKTDAIVFPNFSPVAFNIGPLQIKWYSLAYIFGVLFALFYTKYLNSKLKKPVFMNDKAFDDVLLWAVFGIIIGGRLGYIVFYDYKMIFHDFMQVFRIWHGGMSFHGGMIGLCVGLWYFCRKQEMSFIGLTDLVSCSVPVGLFFGRMANFINGELYGRVTNVPWAIIFPKVDNHPRHPSQIYEALLEGVLLFAILNILFLCKGVRERVGTLSGAFLLLYAIFRIFVELFRKPDFYVLGKISQGQLLCIPMILLGILMICLAKPAERVREREGESK